MGIYNSAVITNTGQALLAQSLAGNDLKFTTVKTSNYTYPSGTSLADLTTLTGIKQSKNITGATVYNSRVIKVSAMVDNAGVTAEYTINTIGVYATIGTAAEQLFAVITAQEADKMPAFNSRPYSYIYDLNMTMQGASNITVTVNNAGFVNINDLNNALEGINANIEALETDKINVSDIVNSLTSSDEDKPLSATMGTELKNYIDNLTEKTTLETSTSLTYDDTYLTSNTYISVYRFGSVCMLQCNLRPKTTFPVDTEIFLCTLPEGYSPLRKINYNVADQSGQPWLFQIYTDGRVSAYAPEHTASDFVRNVLVFPLA